MGQILYEDTLAKNAKSIFAMDDKPYSESNSVHISDDWDTQIEDFIDDFDDYQDLNFPNADDDF